MIYNCSIENCLNTIQISDSVSANFKYICKNHNKPEQTVHFQDHQFERHRYFGDLKLDKSNLIEIARASSVSEYANKNPRPGYQIVGPNDHTGDVPEWAKSDQEVRKLLSLAFPNLDRKQSERIRAGQWGRVIYLYFRMRYTFSQIAEDMDVKEKFVSNILQKVSYVASGLTASGKPRRRKR